MRFSVLPPPREVSNGPPSARGLVEARATERDPTLRLRAVDNPAALGGLAEPAASWSDVHHARLGPAETTSFRLRHLFNPARGWFRRTERAINKFLSHQVFPRVPGMARPYSRALERDLTVSEATLALDRLDDTLAGLRVLLISDFHAGPFLAPEALTRTFDRLLTLEPDLILLAGDFATVRLEEVGPTLPAYQRLSAPLGVYGVLGNHDHYTGDPEALCRMLESTGMEFLHNRSVILGRGEGRLLLAGIDDLLCGEARLDRALEQWPAGIPSLLLSHNPDVFPEAAKRGVSLVLAGHTHGGQWRLPGLPVLVRMSRYRLDEGIYKAAASRLVVSRGLGATGLPFRIGCPPEAVLLTLLPRRER
jgi:predicted MPP superfamily phosphohydrolase